MMKKFNKVIIWGFDNNSHTHYYTHWGWNSAFTHLGYETYWFSDNNHPENFDYENSLFITEGYVDAGIPINDSSTYIVHVCVNPDKYIGRVKRLIDMRYLVDHIYDINYRYVLDKDKATKISDTLYHETLHDNGGISKNHVNPTPMKYEAIYTCWATDLLPHEINLDDAHIQRQKEIYWFGSANPGNTKEIRLFAQECEKNGIRFLTNDPWNNPLPFDFVRQKTKESFMAPDIRTGGDPNKIALGETGTCHKHIGYIACRLFKSISCGQLGITNSKHMYEIMDKSVVYNEDESQLFNDALNNVGDIELIKKQMEIVREKHTFVKRVQDLLKVL
jgi:hypothetical protein